MRLVRCPVHPDVWLYENMVETDGYCPVCEAWYSLSTGVRLDDCDLFAKVDPEKNDL